MFEFLDVAKRSNICCKANLKFLTNNVWSFGEDLRLILSNFRLDKAVNEAMKISPDALVENLRSEVEVWQTEMQGQFYFYMAEVILKMAKEVI